MSEVRAHYPIEPSTLVEPDGLVCDDDEEGEGDQIAPTNHVLQQQQLVVAQLKRGVEKIRGGSGGCPIFWKSSF